MSVRRRRALRAAQHRLQAFYALERAPDVTSFVHDRDDGGRETLILRQTGDVLEMALALPRDRPGNDVDCRAQLIEGVSHFLMVAERARTGLPTTRLELELQAEVDKFVVLALDDSGFDAGRARQLHSRLYERVRYLHPEGTVRGDRYRLANDLAARVVARVVRFGHPEDARPELRRFYRAGQTDKISLALAA